MKTKLLGLFSVSLAACGQTDVELRGGEMTEADESALTQCTGQTVAGIDVSDAQGTIDWVRVKNAGVEFAFMKATQGTYNTNGTFAGNWARSRAAGVIRGAYHFFDPTQDGTAQANHFLSVMGPLSPGDLPPVIDLECPDGNPVCLGFSGGSGATSGAAIKSRLMAFLTRVEAVTGRKPIIYTFPSYLSGNGVDTSGLAAYPLWLAAINGGSCFSVPAPWSAARVWQWDWHGVIPGIPTEVDRNRFLGTRAELLAFASAAPATPTRLEPAGQWATGLGTPDWSASGDFDGDGKADLAWYESWNGGAITVLRSSGGSFTHTGKWIAGLGRPDFAGTGDFDGDGRDDIAWYESWNSGAITVLRSTGSGFVSTGRWASGWGAPDWAGIGDFDGDGKADVAWYEAWNQYSVTVARSSGSGFVGQRKWLSGFGRPDWAGVGDFDGDGDDDLAWFESWASGSITLAHSNRGAFVYGGKWTTGFGRPDFAATGDFDRDGRDDLAWYETWNSGAVTVLRAAGGASKWVTGFGAPSAAAIGDFDGDGASDLAWHELWNNAGVTVARAR